MPQTVTYPLTISNGSLQLSQNEDLILEAILSVLETRPTERIERPEYGTPDFAFESISNALSIVGRVEASLVDQVDGSENLRVLGSVVETGVVELQIKYDIDRTQKDLYLRLEK